MSESVKGILDNASLAAAIGAAGAFFLVVLNDRRRDRRIAKKVLPALLKRLRVLVDGRTHSAKDAESSLGRPMRVRDKGLHFPTERIERYAEQSVDHLTDRQEMALANLVFWMQESDRLNEACLGLLDQLNLSDRDFSRGETSMRLQAPGIIKELGQQYREELVLLRRIDQLIACYLDGTLNERGGITAGDKGSQS
jgi:hypothetical protein